jgi:carbon starvation protein
MVVSSVPSGERKQRARRQGVDPKQVAIWTAVSVVAAIAWGVIALLRGERISAIWLVAAAVGSYAIGYRFYARFIANRVLAVDDTRATPAMFQLPFRAPVPAAGSDEEELNDPGFRG